MGRGRNAAEPNTNRMPRGRYKSPTAVVVPDSSASYYWHMRLSAPRTCLGAVAKYIAADEDVGLDGRDALRNVVACGILCQRIGDSKQRLLGHSRRQSVSANA